MTPMMKCGHAANATRKGKPCCAICVGLTENGAIPVETPPLEGRVAQCSCGNSKPSSLNLAFFEHRPKCQTDSYYCGCRGWD